MMGPRRTFTLIFVTFFLFLGFTSAGGCGGCGSGPCGKIINNSGRSMLYTTNPSTNLNARPGRCHFWNWYDTPTNPNRIVSCSQEPLANGVGKGGCSQKIDVDGFTFPSNAYWVFGLRQGAGVWTKISNIQTLTCRKILGQYVCSA